MKVRLSSKKSHEVNLEGRDHVETLKSVQSWRWLCKYLQRPQITDLTGLALEPQPVENFLVGRGTDADVGETPTGEHSRTGRMLRTCVASPNTLMKGKVSNLEVFPSL